jgi:lipopolysaccharide/colanic/teichoic acid biosynthesis glycosyltransferase
VPFYVAYYTEEQRKILTVRPGITDYASIEYFHENELLAKATDPQKTYIEEIMPAKIALNQRYISNPGFVQDLKIMWLTAKKIMGF